MNKTIAGKLRELAERNNELSRLPGYEASSFFTCTEVENRCGGNARETYEDLYQLGNPFDDGYNEATLWNDDELGDRRTLMLLFAAAMAETGDFP